MDVVIGGPSIYSEITKWTVIDGIEVEQVDTELLIKFIDKHGVDYCRKPSFDSIKTFRLHNFTDYMSSEQLHIFFNKKPHLMFKNADFPRSKPFIPIAVLMGEYNRAIDIVNIILECYKGDPRLKEWKEYFIVHLYVDGYHKQSRMFETLFDIHDKKTKSFFELMRDKLIK